MNNTQNPSSDTSHIKYSNVEDLDPKQFIIIKGAKVNNLKNIDVAIPRNKLVVVTGLSGSGKSSLAFDTLFAEGQRMYVESLSSYARQFLGRMEKPDVDYIKGVSPAIAIEQKVATKNPRSTVGTTTEIYDYFKLLFARAGITYSPISEKEVRKDTVTDVVNFILSHDEGTRVMILTPLKTKEDRKIEKELELLLQKGYTRIVINGEVKQIEDIQEQKSNISDLEKSEHPLEILIDRNVVKHNDEDTQFRFSDSVQTAFFEGEGECFIDILSTNEAGEREISRKIFSDKFELDGIAFEEPSVNLFTFNNPYGACKRCEGYGKVLGIDPELVIPDKNLSVFEGAIAPWRTERMGEWLTPLLRNGIHFDFPIHRAYKDLTLEQQQLLWTGNKYFQGLDAFFADIESQVHKVQYRVMLSRYRGRTDCPDCRGSRLRKDASYVKIGGASITDLVLMPISGVSAFFKNLQLPDYQQAVSKRILIEINSRLEFMERVGLGYLTLNRLTSSLSGGEFQRIKLATSLGSSLVGSMYILDEPSIGLHPRDTQRLVSVLESLRDMGNTVVVVEHEEEVMRAADQIIDIGPDAGTLGGELVFQGNWEDIHQITFTNTVSHTINFLTGKDQISVPSPRRKPTDFIELTGARENNLKELNVKFPLGVLTVVTGVSGSGKSTLVRKILFPAIARLKGEYSEEAGKYSGLIGSLDRITQVEMIDQNPIGKSSRSNPVTYIKAYDYIRQMMAELPLSKARDYKPAFFSFNVDGGRCEACQGEGEQTIEMQFMADVRLKCESCGGKRFKHEILEVKYNEKDISDILAMTVDEAIEFFINNEPKLADKLRPLQDVGLGYIRLGQSSSTLSGGEAQRVKLAFFLSKGNADKGKTLFVFDEPTTGLHFHDIKKLLKAINALVDQGDTVIIIEHNMEIIKSADWIIDLGPDGGEKGGYLSFEGTPEEMIKIEGNYTADFLKEKL
ncbi:UvrABC system protein A [Emticicia aquatica]|uniref:UvrABC system protein A n=1 Tax=Emticicia aquatica TaxID=1681835 RepID=A0ABN8EZ11_9BACT|nr:excinuclease ABC subunit UvrA [Emticicia aquatica]CAH0996382.1 UvrABC system protein A [Emticicia aquatica]